jgi:aspartyl protease family protein
MRSPHCSALVALALACAPALAADVALVGVIGTKAAVIAIDGGNPKTVKVGQTFSGITVLSVSRESAVVQIEGRRRTLALGQHYRSAPTESDRQSVTLAAGARGHFFTEGQVNQSNVRFVVDTGASMVVLPRSDAVRIGLDYRKGRRVVTKTASGVVPAFLVRLDQVRVGEIELTGVDGIVIEEGLDIALLGMSFLNRVEMTREGDTMVLKRRF